MNSSRRTFLKTTAGAGVAAALGTVTVAAEAALGWGAKFGPEGSSIIGSPSGNPE